MDNNAEELVSKFYNSLGWQSVEGVTEDAKRWEDLRDSARHYVSGCRLRVLKYIPDAGERILDMASGPIQYPEYLQFSEGYSKRYCVDLSTEALVKAKDKIGDHGVFLNASFFDIPIQKNFFDCAISLHTIYHIDKDRQEEAVRKLIDVTKPGQPIVIVYSNPSWFSLRILEFPFKVFYKFKSFLFKHFGLLKNEEFKRIYFYSHPLSWWNRFSDVSNVKIYPWRSFNSDAQKWLFPDNSIGAAMFSFLFR